MVSGAAAATYEAEVVREVPLFGGGEVGAEGVHLVGWVVAIAIGLCFAMRQCWTLGFVDVCFLCWIFFTVSVARQSPV